MVYSGQTIDKIYYNYHQIIRAYSCDGKLVYGEPAPTPTYPYKFRATYDDGGPDITVNCNSSTTITSEEMVYAAIEVGRTASTSNHMLHAYIGDCVTEIERGLLAWTATTEPVETLTGVTISDNVTTIGYSFCQGRKALVSIDFPDGVTEIPDYCFYNCEALPAFTIKEGVTTIGLQAFEECRSLLNIVIPSTIQEIGNNAFHLGNFSSTINNNRTVTCLSTTPPTLGIEPFSFNNGIATYPIYVPAESLNAYKTAWNDKIDTNRIQAIA